MSDKFDFARHIAQKIDLLQQKAANDKESSRVAAMDEAHLNDPDSNDFVKNVERQISNALLEAQIEKTSRLEEKLIANDLL